MAASAEKLADASLRLNRTSSTGNARIEARTCLAASIAL
jgi:hypothetical protein